MKFQIGKDDYGKEVTPTYSVTETMDPIRPYLKRKTIIIRNINYTYVDYTTIPGVETEYHVDNTSGQIPAPTGYIFPVAYSKRNLQQTAE